MLRAVLLACFCGFRDLVLLFVCWLYFVVLICRLFTHWVLLWYLFGLQGCVSGSFILLLGIISDLDGFVVIFHDLISALRFIFGRQFVGFVDLGFDYTGCFVLFWLFD